MSSIVWQYFTISEEDNSIAVCNICGAKIKRGSSRSNSYTTSSMHEHLKTQHIESYKKSQSEFLNKDRSCTAPELSKKRKLETIRQTSLDDYKSMKLWDIKDSKAIKVHKKLLKYLDSDSDSAES